MSEHSRRQVRLASDMLDDMARKRAAETGEALEVAYSKALQTPEGRQAYAVMYDHSHDGERTVSPPRPDAATAKAALTRARAAEAELDGLAKAHAASHRVDFAKAYSEVVDTQEGRRLYAEVCEAQDEAAR